MAWWCPLHSDDLYGVSLITDQDALAHPDPFRISQPQHTREAFIDDHGKRSCGRRGVSENSRPRFNGISNVRK